MENKNTFGTELESPFSFLDVEEVKEHFAQLNLTLLEGRHIEPSDYNHYKLLRDYWEELGYYYQNLYQLKLTVRKTSNGEYCYLDFYESGLGKLSDPSKRKDLTDVQTVYGLMLVKMSLDREFDIDKTFKWEQIKQEILEGEHSASYKRILFNKDADRKHFTEKELAPVMKQLMKVLKKFEQMGWVEDVKYEEGEKLEFTLRESISRLTLLYQKEIESFETFSENYKKYQLNK